jgi:hypothetical protein
MAFRADDSNPSVGHSYHNSVYRVALPPISNSMKIGRLFHAPTVLLIIGYPLFWIELYVFRLSHGHTSNLAWILFGLWVAVVLAREWREILRTFHTAWGEIVSRSNPWRSLWVAAILLAGGILIITAWASALPPHLEQEGDAINYHYAMPRQHLVRHSFEHIPWATADLRLLPIQTALAPYWFSSSLPNKFPQFLFLIGLLMILARLVFRLSQGNSWLGPCVACLAVIGSHGFGIQFGTAMLDIPICYLFLAALDSALDGNGVWAAIELAFFALSKSFMPFQLAGLVAATLALFCIDRRDWLHVEWPATLGRKSFNVLTFAVVCVVAGFPFFLNSFLHTGSPLVPFFVGIFKPRIAHSAAFINALSISATQQLATRAMFGQARSLIGLLTSWWWIAVPEKGVNNRFDYPLGLPWLIFLAPFAITVIYTLWRRRLSLVAFLAVCFLLSWWLGSQETRYLYLPLILMIVTVLTETSLSKSAILLAALTVALSLNFVSMYRSNRASFGKPVLSILRPADRDLVLMSQHLGPTSPEGMDVSQSEVTYAEFPVRSAIGLPFWILPLEKRDIR